jgi:hypothetical protein
MGKPGVERSSDRSSDKLLPLARIRWRTPLTAIGLTRPESRRMFNIR